MGEAGVEPARLSAQDPKSCVSADSTTRPNGECQPTTREGKKPVPFQTLNLDEAAGYLHVPREALERLVKKEEIPFHRMGGRILFRRGELDAWASQRILRLTGDGLEEYHRAASRSVSPEESGPDRLMARLTRPEWMEPSLSSRTAGAVLRDMVRLAERTEQVCDPRELLERIQEREELCSTALPGGLAVLHPRHHSPHLVLSSILVVGRTIQGIPFGAPDGTATYLFFLLCCQEDRLHLRTLARLCAMCQKTFLLERLKTAADGREMVAALLESEEALLKSM